MTMDANELRALADAIVYRDSLAIARAADYLRAQADAQPVAWLYYSKHASQPFTTTCPPNTWGPNADDDRKTAVALYTHPALAVPVIQEHGPWLAGRDKQQAWKQQVWIESDDFTHDVRLYVNGDFAGGDQRFAYAQEIARRLNAAPAAPQAEPCIGNDSACPCQDGDACHYKDAADGTKAWPVPQAEPKREPLSDEQIDEIGDPFGYFQYGDAQGDKRRAFVRAIERAHGIGGSDAE